MEPKLQTTQKGEQSSMNDEKPYSTHPGAEHPPTMCMEIPVEEYESIKRENAELKAKLIPLVFSINDLAYVDEIHAKKNFDNIHDHAVYKATEVDAAIEELKDESRKLKHALWLTRADRAKAIQWHEGLDRYLQERKAYWPSRFCFMANDEMYHVWYKCWCEVERKCRAKAEEYK